jgi:hypothetical protein
MVWNPDTGQRLQQVHLTVPPAPGNLVAATDDIILLVGNDYLTISKWDLKTSKLIEKFDCDNAACDISHIEKMGSRYA